MKLLRIVIVVATALVALLSQSTSQATTRARTPAETVLLDSAARIALGSAHTCQVNDDGTARCWGDNSDFQFIASTFGTQLTPVPVLSFSTSLIGVVATAAGGDFTCFLFVGGTVRCQGDLLATLTSITNAVVIAAGSAHACAVLASGGGRCWGDGLFGRLGDGSGNDSSTPVTVRNLTNAVAMAAGSAHTCALLADGTASCWGRNSSGQLGNGTFNDSPIPVPVTGLTNAVAIAAGSDHTCALLASGSARCWGADGSGQLGNGTSPNDPRIPGAVTGLTNAVAIAAGGSHTCALLANGTASCWGLNTSGQLGDDTTTRQLSPVPVRNLTNAVAIGVGKGLFGVSHTCALLADGSARCWGSNGSGQLGDGTTSRKLTPNPVSGGGGSVTARDVAAGSSHTCAVRANSTVACWGLNSSGQLGDGGASGPLSRVPLSVPGLVNAVAIAAGSFHTCVLVSDGNVRCWGDNQFGQLGDGGASGPLSRVPVSVSGLANAVAIAAGHEHTCALLADGTARCWGDNSIGQLGDGTNTNRSTPGPLPAGNLGNVAAIAPGRDHTCLLLASGVVRCWGLNSSGQLGNNSFSNSFAPVTVALSNAVAISAGHFHSCALQAGGAALCWGRNVTGELGIGSTANQSTPITVGLANAVAIAPGVGHTCALVAGGTSVTGDARCWGDNSVGQLGNSSTISFSLTPVVVRTVRQTSGIGGTFTIASPIHNTVGVTTGGRHSCALLATGGVLCWGDNSSGQLGIGSTTNQFFNPVAVPSFTLNIDPSVVLEHNDRVSTVTILATCEAGQRLHVDVTLVQGAVSGHGIGAGECTGGLERYPVTVPAQGRNGFIEGPAQVLAEAVIQERGLVVDTQEWTRVVEIDSAP